MGSNHHRNTKACAPLARPRRLLRRPAAPSPQAGWEVDVATLGPLAPTAPQRLTAPFSAPTNASGCAAFDGLGTAAVGPVGPYSRPAPQTMCHSSMGALMQVFFAFFLTKFSGFFSDEFVVLFASHSGAAFRSPGQSAANSVAGAQSSPYTLQREPALLEPGRPCGGLPVRRGGAGRPLPGLRHRPQVRYRHIPLGVSGCLSFPACTSLSCGGARPRNFSVVSALGKVAVHINSLPFSGV